MIGWVRCDKDLLGKLLEPTEEMRMLRENWTHLFAVSEQYTLLPSSMKVILPIFMQYALVT